MNIEKARFNMIEQQVKPWNIVDQRLIKAMVEIPREKFIPESYQNLAYADIAIPLGHNQNMLAPREIARLLQALELQGDEKVLEVGCGSGYASALLAKLASKVYSIDIVSDFVASASQKLKKLSLTNVTVEEGDGSDGYLAHAPYDAILITSAMPELPNNLKRCLNARGRLVAILGTQGHYQAMLCKLDSQGEWQKEALFPLKAKPMVNTPQPNRFEF